MSENLRKSLSRASTRSSLYGGPGTFSPALLAPEKEANDVIELAKRDLEKLKRKEKKKKRRYRVGFVASKALCVFAAFGFCESRVGLNCVSLLGGESESQEGENREPGVLWVIIFWLPAFTVHTPVFL